MRQRFSGRARVSIKRGMQEHMRTFIVSGFRILEALLTNRSRAVVEWCQSVESVETTTSLKPEGDSRVQTRRVGRDVVRGWRESYDNAMRRRN